VESRVSRLLFNTLLRRQCNDSIPRSGERALRVNCYVTYLKYGEDDWALLVQSVSEYGLTGRYWDGSSFSTDTSIPFQYIEGASLEINHYYKVYDFKYNSISEYVLKDLSQYFRLIVFRNEFSQFVFNRQELALSERINVLKVLLQQTVENDQFQVSEVSLGNLIHGDRWILHPDRARQQRHSRLILESLAESGELERVQYGYRITDRAITTISEYEAANTRHSETVTQSKQLKWLTFALIIVGLLQAAATYFGSK
jgi:hypothetical protein